MKPGLLMIVAGILSICYAQKEPPEATFWQWFQANEIRLFNFEADQESVFKNLSSELHRVHPALTFEFGPKENGKREFVISADGIKDAFPVVIALADAAPALPRWKIIKFRPRRGLGPIKFQGLKVAPEQVEFTVEPDHGKVGITLFIDGYNESVRNRYISIAFLILDHVLGEYDVEKKLGYVELRPSDARSEMKKRPLSELASSVDRLVQSQGRKSP